MLGLIVFRTDISLFRSLILYDLRCGLFAYLSSSFESGSSASFSVVRISPYGMCSWCSLISSIRSWSSSLILQSHVVSRNALCVRVLPLHVWSFGILVFVCLWMNLNSSSSMSMVSGVWCPGALMMVYNRAFWKSSAASSSCFCL